MNKEDLIKLAVVAGYEKAPCSPEDCYSKSNWGGGTNDVWMDQNRQYVKVWQPGKDIAQAFEVLEGLGHPFTIDREVQDDCLWYEVSIYSKDSELMNGYNDPYNDGSDNTNLPESICQAVINAQGEG